MHCRGRSTARFTEKWQKSVGDEGFLEQVVERWRSAGIGTSGDATTQAAMMADALGISSHEEVELDPVGGPDPYGRQNGYGYQQAPQQQPPLRPAGMPAAMPRAYAAPAAAAAPPALRSSTPMRRDMTPPPPPVMEPAGGSGNSLRSLRERLTRPK